MHGEQDSLSLQSACNTCSIPQNLSSDITTNESNEGVQKAGKISATEVVILPVLSDT